MLVLVLKNALLHLINNEPVLDKIYLYAKGPYKTKYKILISERETTGLKFLNDSKAFIEYSNEIADIFKNIEEYDLAKKQKISIVFDDVTADMLDNKNPIPIVTELFIKGIKVNIFLVFIKQSYFPVPENVTLTSIHYFVMKILNKRELQQIAFNFLSDIDKTL